MLKIWDPSAQSTHSEASSFAPLLCSQLLCLLMYSNESLYREKNRQSHSDIFYIPYSTFFFLSIILFLSLFSFFYSLYLSFFLSFSLSRSLSRLFATKPIPSAAPKSTLMSSIFPSFLPLFERWKTRKGQIGKKRSKEKLAQRCILRREERERYTICCTTSIETKTCLWELHFRF